MKISGDADRLAAVALLGSHFASAQGLSLGSMPRACSASRAVFRSRKIRAIPRVLACAIKYTSLLDRSVSRIWQPREFQRQPRSVEAGKSVLRLQGQVEI